MAKELDIVSLLDVFPPSIREDLNVQANAVAFDPEFHLLAKDVKEVLLYPSLDELPEPVLDLLAWERHVDFYELARTVEAKREVIRGAPAWHRKKGTVWAILKALEMIGVKGTFTNWYEQIPRGNPYTFHLDAELTDEYWKRSDWNDPVSVIFRAIMESKAARSWMSGIDIRIDAHAVQNVYASMGILHDVYRRVPAAAPKPVRSRYSVFFGLGVAQSVRRCTHAPRAFSSRVRLGLCSAAASVCSIYQRVRIAS